MYLEASLNGIASNLTVIIEVVVAPLDCSIWLLVVVLAFTDSVLLIRFSFISNKSHILSIGYIDFANIFVSFFLNQNPICNLHSR